MEILWHKHAQDDYRFWQKTDLAIFKYLNSLIKESLLSPYEGKGNPRPLKGVLANYWSRRIDDEHRLVYKIKDGNLLILQCRFH